MGGNTDMGGEAPQIMSCQWSPIPPALGSCDDSECVILSESLDLFFFQCCTED